MFITVSQLANKINNLERFTMTELNQDIIKISVFLSSNKREIKYYVYYRTKEKDREVYTEKNVPGFIVELMNENKVIYHEIKHNGEETFVYSFI